ncbi:MAG TPA: hypothetical protein VIM75_23905 [Ohtaekwangia sp.]|uniref:hypothetical protein n=1 Tax=Ohtaekwangia sp. TaxID=2066019 RepID=UPI002F944EFB
MEQVTDEELLELYNDTINKCGIYLLNEADETIEYNIYEDFDIGVHSFLYTDNLQKLYSKGLISIDKLNKSILLHNKVIDLQSSDEWKFENFRTSEKWKEIMRLCDEIRATH